MFYFRPGHETIPYHQDEIGQVLRNVPIIVGLESDVVPGGSLRWQPFRFIEKNANLAVLE